MAATTKSLAPSNSSDSLFRAWGKAISDQFAAGGMVKSTDTGQVDWDAVSAPSGTNTDAGYEIWKSNDAEGDLHDYYIKLSYGEGSSTDVPRLSITIGWGSDGSGNLTGNVGTTAIIRPNSASTDEFNCNLCVGKGDDPATGVAVCMWATENTGFIAFCIERTRAVSGAFEDQVLLWARGGGSGTNVNQVVPISGTVPTNITTAGYGVRSIAAANAGYEGNVGVSTFAPLKGGWLMEAMNFFGGDTTNFTAGQMSYTFTVYGDTHTYILAGFSNSVPNTSMRLLTRYE